MLWLHNCNRAIGTELLSVGNLKTEAASHFNSFTIHIISMHAYIPHKREDTSSNKEPLLQVHYRKLQTRTLHANATFCKEIVNNSDDIAFQSRFSLFSMDHHFWSASGMFDSDFAVFEKTFVLTITFRCRDSRTFCGFHWRGRRGSSCLILVC